MIIDDNLITQTEKLVYNLKKLYASYGYQPYRMSRFEEYDLYAGNKDFLVSDNVLTFTDTNGKLMALKPDVTLSIIKNSTSTDLSDDKRKVFYNENVYRSDKDSGSFKEILQTGLECFGNINTEDIRDVILLAVRSLQEISSDGILMISNLTVIDELISQPDLSKAARTDLFKAISERNLSEIDFLGSSYGIPEERIALLKELLQCHGPLPQVRKQLGSILSKLSFISETASFLEMTDILTDSNEANYIGIDFSITDDINYYNGIIFKGYISTLPKAILSGGQYDRLMEKMYRHARAIGFAVYTSMVEQSENQSEAQKDEYINIALPKGRLGEKVYKMFAEAGYDCPEILEDNRKLLFENIEKKVRYFWVKPADTVIYVENGVADIGVAGKDILLENEAKIYELLDLKTGICKMAVAAPVNYEDDPSRPLKIATKFPNIAREHYKAPGREIEIIKLNGSIEIAPLLGLSDVIVDIVETGRTLKENNLAVKESFLDISARLIANQSAYAFKAERIKELVANLAETVR